ncbi:O-methyl transferase B protein [Rutstroemia sp. NJR-2017a BBW]|nr:O-methyl transferase B protein [Rutstroemia sp. NJR-2017a BBW]
MGPQFQALPSFLKKSKYQDITDPSHTVMQAAFDFEGMAFDWMGLHPENLAYFNDYMAGRRHDTNDEWLSVYPVEAETAGWKPEDPVFVDMGGSIGHQCAKLKAKYPNLPGRVILQDLPHTIAVALQTPGVENMSHDLFGPQSVKGAKFYYMRAVLHDWPDHVARKILSHINAAMNKDSVLLIDEMVLPDVGVYSQVAAIDLAMMCATGSTERTESQWKTLFAEEGLELIETRTYKPTSYESVMKVVRKQDV